MSFTVRRAVAKNCPGPGYVQQDAAFERYTLGSQLGCCRGVELALETMREGEVASFHVRVRHLPPDTAYPEEITISLSKIHQDVILLPGVGGGGGAPGPGSAAGGFALVKRRTKWGSAKTDGGDVQLTRPFVTV